MSVILPIPDLFDPNNGIYTHPLSRWTRLERACSMELVFPDGSGGGHLDCGLQIQGAPARPAKTPNDSFRRRRRLKGRYGPTSKLRSSRIV